MKTLTRHGKIFGIQRSCLSAIIQMFLEALYKVAIPYLNNPSIWHNRMPYFAELIQNKTNGIAENIWGFIDAQFTKPQDQFITKEWSTHGSKMTWYKIPISPGSRQIYSMFVQSSSSKNT